MLHLTSKLIKLGLDVGIDSGSSGLVVEVRTVSEEELLGDG